MKFATSILILGIMVCSARAGNTVVRFDTILGDIEVLLYDTKTPATVSNFMSYVNRDAYKNSFFHRSVPNFVIQGGGYTIQTNVVVPVETDPSVTNEFFYSNVRGTIAMAKVANNPDSATSQWFFNVVDNTFLDQTNGGFTVFGHVLGNGMQIVDLLAAVPFYNASAQLGPAFTQLPLLTNSLASQYLLVVSNITVVPFGVDTMSISGAEVNLSWSGPASTGVNVERASALTPEEWSLISITNRMGFLRDDNVPGEAVFYRLRLPD